MMLLQINSMLHDSDSDGDPPAPPSSTAAPRLQDRSSTRPAGGQSTGHLSRGSSASLGSQLTGGRGSTQPAPAINARASAASAIDRPLTPQRSATAAKQPVPGSASKWEQRPTPKRQDSSRYDCGIGRGKAVCVPSCILSLDPAAPTFQPSHHRCSPCTRAHTHTYMHTLPQVYKPCPEPLEPPTHLPACTLTTGP